MRKNKYMRHIAGIRKCLAIGLTAAMCMAMLAGCSTSQSTSSTSDTEVTSDVSTETDADKESPNGSADAENTSVKTEMTVEEMQAAIDEAMSDAAIDITDMFTKRDLAGNYDESEAVKITLSGKTAACNSSNVQIEDGVVTIKAAGVYVLSGTFTDGTIVVDAGDDDKVQLVLDGVSITAADYAAIYAKNADKVFVTLAEGAGNSLMVSGDYVQTDDNNVDAVIFAKCDLTLNGTGSLTVKDNTGHGIVSKDDLVVTGGTYTIYSQDHCLNGKDSVRIADGTFNLSCDEDGIHAGNDDHSPQEKYESTTIKAELYMWKLDVISSMGVAIAFAVQTALLHTKLRFITPYIDPAVAVVMALLLIKEPVCEIFQSIKNLILFAPEEETLSQIRAIVDQHMKDYPYEVTFLDVIQTGRKLWVEVYIGNQTDVIHISIIHKVRDEIKQELRDKYDQVYIEVIPD